MKQIVLAALFAAGFAPNADALVCHTNRATGQVVAPDLIRMNGFHCDLNHISGISYHSKDPVHDRQPSVMMHVSLRNSADAARMKPGSIVTLSGNFHATRDQGADMLSVQDATIITPAADRE